VQAQQQQTKPTGPPPSPAELHTVYSQLADSFGTTFTIGVVLVALCLIPAFLLPRHKLVGADTDRPAEAAILV
jgi:hypothetical protein